MAQVNLTTPYGTINIVRVQGINIDPLANKIYASVYYAYQKDNNVINVAAVRYSTNAQDAGMEQLEFRGSVILSGADYTSYNNYIGAGKSPQEAVLQILLDRAVIAGTLV